MEKIFFSPDEARVLRVHVEHPFSGMRIKDRDDCFPKDFPGGVYTAMSKICATAHDFDMLTEEAGFEEVDEYYNPGTEEVPYNYILEAITVDKFSKTEHRMNAVVRTLNKHLKDNSSEITALPAVVGKPKKSGSFAYVTVQLPFSDGQSVSVIFHAPEGDKRQITPNDTIIAFRWLLNRRDITQVVAPEDGAEVSLDTIAMRISQLVVKNAGRFERTQKEAAAERKQLEEIRENLKEAEAKQTELMDTVAAAAKDAETIEAKLANTLALLEKQKGINAELEAKLAAMQAAAVDDKNVLKQNGSDSQNPNTEPDLSITAPKSVPQRAQTFIVEFYAMKDAKMYENFERFNLRTLKGVIDNLKGLLVMQPYSSSIEKGEWKYLKIYTTFNDSYNRDGAPVLEMSLADFCKRFDIKLNVQPASETDINKGTTTGTESVNPDGYYGFLEKVGNPEKVKIWMGRFQSANGSNNKANKTRKDRIEEMFFGGYAWKEDEFGRIEVTNPKFNPSKWEDSRTDNWKVIHLSDYGKRYFRYLLKKFPDRIRPTENTGSGIDAHTIPLTNQDKKDNKYINTEQEDKIITKIPSNAIHATADKTAKQVAIEWIEKNVQEPVQTEAGEVVVDKTAIKRSLEHGIYQNKLDAIQAIVPVLQNGRFLGSLPDNEGKPIENFYFAGKVQIGDSEKIVFIRTRLAEGSPNRMYVHEVFTEEEIENRRNQGTASAHNGGSQFNGPFEFYKSILAGLVSVNTPDTKKSNLDGGSGSGDVPSFINTLNDILAGKYDQDSSMAMDAFEAALNEAEAAGNEGEYADLINKASNRITDLLSKEAQ